MLEEKFNKQVSIATWQLILCSGAILGCIIMMASAFTLSFNWENSLPIGWIMAWIIALVCGVAQLILWILGIINAIQINSITQDSTVLIIFSIFTFWFGHLIVAILERNKSRTHQFRSVPININNEIPVRNTSHSSFEEKLKASFIDGVITADEYKEKLDAHNKK